MQIVIDIPDEQIKKCLEESKNVNESEGEKGSVEIDLLYTNKNLEFVAVVRKKDFYSLKNRYTVLPENHGRLIDADALEGEPYLMSEGNGMYRTVTGYFRVEDAPTIIEGTEGKE